MFYWLTSLFFCYFKGFFWIVDALCWCDFLTLFCWMSLMLIDIEIESVVYCLKKPLMNFDCKCQAAWFIEKDFDQMLSLLIPAIPRNKTSIYSLFSGVFRGSMVQKWCNIGRGVVVSPSIYSLFSGVSSCCASFWFCRIGSKVPQNSRNAFFISFLFLILSLFLKVDYNTTNIVVFKKAQKKRFRKEIALKFCFLNLKCFDQEQTEPQQLTSTDCSFGF